MPGVEVANHGAAAVDGPLQQNSSRVSRQTASSPRTIMPQSKKYSIDSAPGPYSNAKLPAAGSQASRARKSGGMAGAIEIGRIAGGGMQVQRARWWRSR